MVARLAEVVECTVMGQGAAEATNADHSPAPYVELCLRCGAGMEWRHQTWQCARCRFKIGCCEGDTAECAPPTR
jgi:hypothetical protein